MPQHQYIAYVQGGSPTATNESQNEMPILRMKQEFTMKSRHTVHSKHLCIVHSTLHIHILSILLHWLAACCCDGSSNRWKKSLMSTPLLSVRPPRTPCVRSGLVKSNCIVFKNFSFSSDCIFGFASLCFFFFSSFLKNSLNAVASKSRWGFCALTVSMASEPEGTNRNPLAAWSA